MRSFILTLISFVLSFKALSTHIVGGEIFYDCLGNNNYRITLKLYRDCINGMAPYDNPAAIGVFNSSGTLLQTLYVNFPGATQVPSSINNPCIVPPTNICVEEAVYTTTVHLPPIPGGYIIAYQRCCRNNTIMNLVNPGNVGSTYMCHIPDQSLANCNSSPRYNNFPRIFICSGMPLNFDHSATDPDGDVLVYKLCAPYDGASSLNPMPQPPNPPPYSTVPFLPPYSGTYPMSSSPPIAVDMSNGLLTGTPNMIGQWVVGVCVEEWRNGQLLSVNKRDFQFNVVNCPPVPVSSIPSQITYCFGMTVNFQNASVNGTTWHWNFGDPNATNDTSNLFAPSWTYSQPGTYNVMLIANPGSPCADTGWTTFQVYPLLAPTFTAPSPQCFQGNSFNFSVGGTFGGGPGTTSFNWNFGANATPATDTSQNVSNVTYNAPGNYIVSLIVSENGCADTLTDTVTVLSQDVLNYTAPPVEGCAPLTVYFSDSMFAHPAITQVAWAFGDGHYSVLPNTSHTYTQPGVYTVSLYIATNNSCMGNFNFTVPAMVTIHPSPIAGLTATPINVTTFDPVVTFTDISTGASNCWIYFGDGDSSNLCNTTHTYETTGEYTVTQVVENEYGCRDVFELTIYADMDAVFWIPNAFTPNGDGKNEFFAPVANGVQNFRFMIFDRWGNLIFESFDINKGWDGKVHRNNRNTSDKIAQEDVYVWKCEYENAGKNNVKHQKIGHVTLVR